MPKRHPSSESGAETWPGVAKECSLICYRGSIYGQLPCLREFRWLMTAWHPQPQRCLRRKGHLLHTVWLLVRVSRKDGVGISGATVPDVSNRHSAPQQPCAWSTLHYTMREPDTPSGERFCGRRSRSSAAKAPHDTALKLASMWSSCVNFAQSHFILLLLSDTREPVFPSYSLTILSAAFPSIWPRHSFGTHPNYL